MDSATFRRLGHAMVDWVADYRDRIGSLPVRSAVAPGEIRARFPASPPARGGGMDRALEIVERDVLPGITHWNHPAWFAYFPSNTGFASILADLVASGLGSQGMNWETSPAATEVEEVVMEWLRQMVGLPADYEGVIHDTASTATLCALICARERSTGLAQSGEGLQGDSPALVVYTSDQAHSSVEKAVRLAGLGLAHLRIVESDDAYAIRADRLAEAIARDRADGLRPCAIFATTGTTATTAMDPLGACADLAARHGMWLHVDAAMAGSAMVLPECRGLWTGVERADSIVLNPHKWMGVGFDLSAYFVGDAQHLVRVMSMNPSYLRTARDAEVKNLRDWGIPLGRRFRALKLLFLLLDEGVEGIQARLRRDLEHAQWFAAQVDAASDWQRMAPVPLQTVCVRHVPEGVSEEPRLAAHQRAIADRINTSGVAYLTPTVVKGVQLLRVSFGSAATEREHVEALWVELRKAAAEIA